MNNREKMSKKKEESKKEPINDSHLPPIEFHGRTYFQTDFEGCAMICDEIIDVRKLGRDFPSFPAQHIVENNCIECGKLANEYFETTTRWSLARLTALLLKKKLAKPGKVRKGKWHMLPLNEAQKSYAATDAYASLLTYMSLQAKLADKSS